jgi:hypothetical protein
MRVDFKSIPEYYRKEMLGLKRNTVRKIDRENERFQFLEDWMNHKIDNLTIRIIQTQTTESFERQITDVTKFDDYYIISW